MRPPPARLSPVAALVVVVLAAAAAVFVVVGVEAAATVPAGLLALTPGAGKGPVVYMSAEDACAGRADGQFLPDQLLWPGFGASGVVSSASGPECLPSAISRHGAPLPALSFAIDVSMTFDYDFPAGQDYTIFTIDRFVDELAARGSTLGSATNSDFTLGKVDGGNGVGMYGQGDEYWEDAHDDQFDLGTLRVAGTGATSGGTYWLNSFWRYLGWGGPTYTPAGRLAYNGDTATSGQFLSDFDVSHIIVYNYALTDIQVALVSNWLNDRYRIWSAESAAERRAVPAAILGIPGLPAPAVYLSAEDACTTTGQRLFTWPNQAAFPVSGLRQAGTSFLIDEGVVDPPMMQTPLFLPRCVDVQSRYNRTMRAVRISKGAGVQIEVPFTEQWGGEYTVVTIDRLVNGTGFAPPGGSSMQTNGFAGSSIDFQIGRRLGRNAIRLDSLDLLSHDAYDMEFDMTGMIMHDESHAWLNGVHRFSTWVRGSGSEVPRTFVYNQAAVSGTKRNRASDVDVALVIIWRAALTHEQMGRVMEYFDRRFELWTPTPATAALAQMPAAFTNVLTGPPPTTFMSSDTLQESATSAACAHTHVYGWRNQADHPLTPTAAAAVNHATNGMYNVDAAVPRCVQVTSRFGVQTAAVSLSASNGLLHAGMQEFANRTSPAGVANPYTIITLDRYRRDGSTFKAGLVMASSYGESWAATDGFIGKSPVSGANPISAVRIQNQDWNFGPLETPFELDLVTLRVDEYFFQVYVNGQVRAWEEDLSGNIKDYMWYDRLAWGTAGTKPNWGSDLETVLTIVFDRALSDAELYNVHRVLNERYGIWSAPGTPAATPIPASSPVSAVKAPVVYLSGDTCPPQVQADQTDHEVFTWRNQANGRLVGWSRITNATEAAAVQLPQCVTSPSRFGHAVPAVHFTEQSGLDIRYRFPPGGYGAAPVSYTIMLVDRYTSASELRGYGLQQTAGDFLLTADINVHSATNVKAWALGKLGVQGGKAGLRVETSFFVNEPMTDPPTHFDLTTVRMSPTGTTVWINGVVVREDNVLTTAFSPLTVPIELALGNRAGVLGGDPSDFDTALVIVWDTALPTTNIDAIHTYFDGRFNLWSPPPCQYFACTRQCGGGLEILNTGGGQCDPTLELERPCNTQPCLTCMESFSATCDPAVSETNLLGICESDANICQRVDCCTFFEVEMVPGGSTSTVAEADLTVPVAVGFVLVVVLVGGGVAFSKSRAGGAGGLVDGDAPPKKGSLAAPVHKLRSLSKSIKLSKVRQSVDIHDYNEMRKQSIVLANKAGEMDGDSDRSLDSEDRAVDAELRRQHKELNGSSSSSSSSSDDDEKSKKPSPEEAAVTQPAGPRPSMSKAKTNAQPELSMSKTEPSKAETKAEPSMSMSTAKK